MQIFDRERVIFRAGLRILKNTAASREPRRVLPEFPALLCAAVEPIRVGQQRRGPLPELTALRCSSEHLLAVLSPPTHEVPPVPTLIRAMLNSRPPIDDCSPTGEDDESRY